MVSVFVLIVLYSYWSMILLTMCGAYCNFTQKLPSFQSHKKLITIFQWRTNRVALSRTYMYVV